MYGYVFNTSAQNVAIEADVAFSSNGLLLGVTHAPGTTDVVFQSAGAYQVDFLVSGVEPNQFALYLNGSLVPGTTYGSGAGTQQNGGMAIIAISAGDVLTLRNHSSSAAVGLQTLAGGTQTNVNAAIAVVKLD